MRLQDFYYRFRVTDILLHECCNAWSHEVQAVQTELGGAVTYNRGVIAAAERLRELSARQAQLAEMQYANHAAFRPHVRNARTATFWGIKDSESSRKKLAASRRAAGACVVGIWIWAIRHEGHRLPEPRSACPGTPGW